jgi:hypothetical protein
LYAEGLKVIAIPRFRKRLTGRSDGNRLHDRVHSGRDLAGYRSRAVGWRIVGNVTWNAVCLAGAGNVGIAFVALPEFPPRNVTWAKGRWIYLAKIALDKDFLHKMRSGNTDPVVLTSPGIERLRTSCGFASAR